MKKLLLLLLLAVAAQYSAQAQETMHKKVVTHHYYHHKVVRRHVAPHHTMTTTSRHGIKVTQDAPHNPYEGKPSQQNDGVKKNEQRNMNYQSGQPLAPSNGSNTR